jgi:hypothetical protein
VIKVADTYTFPVQIDTSMAAVIAAAVFLFTCRHLRKISGFVIGLNRRVLRVGACEGLMAETCAPFGLDAGGPGPAAMTIPQASPGPGTGIAAKRSADPASGTAPGEPQAWTPGRMAAVVTGVVLVLCSIGLLGLGGTALWADTAGRHGGYVSLGSETYHSGGYAVTTGAAELHAAGSGWDAARPLFGSVRIRATSTTANKPAFVGIARARAVSDYLDGVAHTTVRGAAATSGVSVEVSGTAPAVPPSRAPLWVARGSGSGAQTLIWPDGSGNWQMVVMNADSSRPVSVTVNIAARLPALTGIAAGLLATGAVCLVAGVILIGITMRRAPRQTASRQRE